MPEHKIETGNDIVSVIMENSVNEDEGKLSFKLQMIFRWLNIIYLSGSIITFALTLLTIGHLIYISRKSKKMDVEDIVVKVHNNKNLSTFSWCNEIFLYRDALSLDLRELEILVCHENAHLCKCHWVDLAITQIVLIFQWFNPAVWFIRRELHRIHEYEADETVLKFGIDEKEYQMLLIRNISGKRFAALIDGMNSCSLKKRILMMKKTEFKKDWIPRCVAVLVFAGIAGLIIHTPAVTTLLQDSNSNVVYNEENNQSDQNMAMPTIKVELNGEESNMESIKSLKSEYIESMTIIKSDEVTKIEVKTKND